MIMWLGEMLKRLSGTGDGEEMEGCGRNKERLGYGEDRTGTAARLDDILDRAIDEYFPIWAFDHGNSRDTKVPHGG